jgi:hypothetical protein
MDVQTVYFIVSIAALAAGAIVAYFRFVTKISSRVAAIEERCKNQCSLLPKLAADVAAITVQVAHLESQNEVFWKVLEPHMAQIIHSPTAHDRDSLVDKLVNGDITRDEARELSQLLEAALARSDWPPEKKFAGVLLLARTRTILEVPSGRGEAA